MDKSKHFTNVIYDSRIVRKAVADLIKTRVVNIVRIGLGYSFLVSRFNSRVVTYHC